ncbi:hypothetical protein [Tessaracoccus flavescens]|uniref:DUF5668 domain-containing protein n=1 Tax=Tessaracoccus flavescens TaxID=399497 RepID=A0A1Q2CXX3_9ACTN|nr:hypothetical protein [Tessaracoccus flavescens]AQP50927.1 hypothetical protein BW733_08895 [Tessaracoccus flavescens]
MFTLRPAGVALVGFSSALVLFIAGVNVWGSELALTWPILPIAAGAGIAIITIDKLRGEQ